MSANFDKNPNRDIRLVVVGASAGGVEAIRRLLAQLTINFTLPMIIVQHLPPASRLDVSLIYGTGRKRKIIEAEDKIPLLESTTYMAAPDYHILVERDMTIALSQEDPVKHSRPSIDVLFESAARSLGSQVAGVLLTGASSDGADGLYQIHEAGGITIVQDPQEAECKIMPASAIALFKPDIVRDVHGIASYINAHFSQPAEALI